LAQLAPQTARATVRPNFVAVSAKLVTLNWRVSGITAQAIPFDFCIGNFRALPN
jgi:hypothetical protein